MSKFATVLIGVLLGALNLASASEAKTVSKYCRLLSGKQIGRPLRASNVSTSSVTLRYPSETKSAKGKLTLCSHRIPSDLIAQTSVAKFTNSKGARAEFAATVHRERKTYHVVKTRGPWNDAYYLGEDGFVALKGKFIFHIQYASGARGFSSITAQMLAQLAAGAVRKL